MDFPGIVLFRYKVMVVENMVKIFQELFRLKNKQTLLLFFFFHKINTNMDEFKVDVSTSVDFMLNGQVLRKLVGQ